MISDNSDIYDFEVVNKVKGFWDNNKTLLFFAKSNSNHSLFINHVDYYSITIFIWQQKDLNS